MVKVFQISGFYSIADTNDSDSEEYQDYSEDMLTESSTDSTSFRSLPCHDSCFIHTLQLEVKDGLQDAGYLNKVMGKASSIVN